MGAISRITGMLLLIAVVSALPGTHAVALSAKPPAPPARCHSRGPVLPSHTPVSYQCCGNAHQAAIPNPAFSLRPLVAWVSELNDGARFSLASTAAHSATLVIPANSPPGSVPLRI